MPLIDPKRVQDILVDCLLKENELDNNHKPKNGVRWVKVSGVVHNFGLSEARLREHSHEINEMLDNLPDQFHEDKGGGWSFLNACQDKNDEQWTGFHQRMDELFCLGIGIGRVAAPMPREMWGILPGGMPYYVVLKRGNERAVNVMADGLRDEV